MMRNLLLVASLFASTNAAAAADLSRLESEPRWAGLYAGIHAAGAWGFVGWKAPGLDSFPASGPSEGTVLGGQFGYLHQSGPLVFGMEGRIGWTNAKALVACGTNDPSGWTCETRSDLLASLAGRVGYDLGGMLPYLTAGLAVKHGKSNERSLDIAKNAYTGASQAEPGWLVGLGLEYAIDDAWSVQAEYAYHDFGTARLKLTEVQGAVFRPGIREYLHTATLSLNYRLWVPDGDPAAEPPLVLSGWHGEFGVRYWLSTGKFGYKSSESNVSFTGLTGHSGEAFGRLDYEHRLFLKGYFGAGGVPGGKLVKEDFPPTYLLHSKIRSDQEDGRLRYASIDAGLTLFANEWARLGTFVGYHFSKEKLDTYGCEQLTSIQYCSATDSRVSDPYTSQATGWQSVRLGIVADANLGSRATLTLDAAYLITSSFDGESRSWDFPDHTINPRQKGDGSGFQLEARLAYQLTDRLALGLGSRYWSMEVPRAIVRRPELQLTLSDLFDKRYGAFFEASYQFGM